LRVFVFLNTLIVIPETGGRRYWS